VEHSNASSLLTEQTLHNVPSAAEFKVSNNPFFNIPVHLLCGLHNKMIDLQCLSILYPYIFPLQSLTKQKLLCFMISLFPLFFKKFQSVLINREKKIIAEVSLSNLIFASFLS